MHERDRSETLSGAMWAVELHQPRRPEDALQQYLPEPARRWTAISGRMLPWRLSRICMLSCMVAVGLGCTTTRRYVVSREDSLRLTGPQVSLEVEGARTSVTPTAVEARDAGGEVVGVFAPSARASDGTHAWATSGGVTSVSLVAENDRNSERCITDGGVLGTLISVPLGVFTFSAIMPDHSDDGLEDLTIVFALPAAVAVSLGGILLGRGAATVACAKTSRASVVDD